MKPTATLSALLLAALLQLGVVPTSAYTNPIAIKNYKMYDAKTGLYFGVKGIDYYPRPNAGELNENNIDLFTDDRAAIWGPDIEHLAAAGANAVRLYAVDPSKSHDKFMCALRSYGMYALVDFGASCEGCAITKDTSPTCYPATLKTRGEMIIDAFAKYDNILAFSAGNEINHVAAMVTDNAPCQKKFIRDMRAYIASCATLRQIPVGVVLADSANQRDLNAKYYNCRTNGSDPYENAEWYGLNVYLQCDGALTDASPVGGGFQIALDAFTSYQLNIPVLLTEFGCLHRSFPTVKGYDAQRTWLQAGWLYNKDFRKQFNGGFVFEYSTEKANSEADSPYPFTAFGAQNYGLGYYSPINCDHGATPCVYNRMPNFDSLAKKYNATDFSDEPKKDAFTPASTKVAFPACPAGFKKLSEISWTTVDAVSTSCPSVAQEFTCPNQESSGLWTAASAGSTTNAPLPPAPTAPGTTTTPSPSSTNKMSAAGSVLQSAFVTLLAVAAASAFF
jgi:1,3-beta-glucanosyltransferase GAS5